LPCGVSIVARLRTTLEAALQVARTSVNPEACAHAALGLHALADSLDAGRETVELLDDAATWLATSSVAASIVN
jgi:hypothetical protein